MPGKRKKADEPKPLEEQPVADEVPAADQASEAAAQMADDAIEDAVEEVAEEQDTVPAADYEAAQQQVQELKERLVRNQADFDNIRKRLRREADEAGNRAIVRFVRPILNEIDNFNRAIEAANPDAFQDFAAGVSMIRDNLTGILRDASIEAVPSEGVFDPSVHEVMAEVENDELPKGSIVEVYRSGFKLGDQLVRSAQVVVSKPSAAQAEG